MNIWEPDLLATLRAHGIATSRSDPLVKRIRREVDACYIRGDLNFEVAADAVIMRTRRSDGSVRITRIPFADPARPKESELNVLELVASSFVTTMVASATMMRVLRLFRPAAAISGALRISAIFLPNDERADWIEEQKGYLDDMTKRQKFGWIIRQLIAMPRYAYTVRTGREKESA